LSLLSFFYLCPAGVLRRKLGALYAPYPTGYFFSSSSIPRRHLYISKDRAKFTKEERKMKKEERKTKIRVFFLLFSLFSFLFSLVMGHFDTGEKFEAKIESF